MGDPDLVVLDEPMSGLDPLGRREVRELIFELREEGKTVFFCTHILDDATRLCDRVGIIVKGKLRDVGPLGELLDPRVDTVDVVWAHDDADARRGLATHEAVEHRATSEGHVARATATDAADAFVRAVVEAGGRILSVSPHRQGLEDLFVTEAAREEEG
jgi:ABC-2 type transport system ATP-binding protein